MLAVFDDMTADIESNKKLSPIVLKEEGNSKIYSFGIIILFQIS